MALPMALQPDIRYRVGLKPDRQNTVPLEAAPVLVLQGACPEQPMNKGVRPLFMQQRGQTPMALV